MLSMRMYCMVHVNNLLQKIYYWNVYNINKRDFLDLSDLWYSQIVDDDDDYYYYVIWI